MANLLAAGKIRVKCTQSSKVNESLFPNEKFADVHFLSDINGQRERVLAHTCILASASDVFANMLDVRWKEKD